MPLERASMRGTIGVMARILALSVSAVMYGIASAAVAQTSPVAHQNSDDVQISAAQDPPKAPPKAPKAPDVSKYGGFLDLVKANREAFVKLAAKAKELKGQSPPKESTFKEYREAEAAFQQASAKASGYMQQKRWTDEDRAVMSAILAEELSKPIP